MPSFLDDVELYGLWRGFRALVKKEGPHAERLLAHPAILDGSGFHLRRNPQGGTLFVARDPALLDEVVALEDIEMAGGNEADRHRAVLRIGHLLGYPDCCSAAFADLPKQDDEFVLQHLLETEPPDALPWLLNFLPPLVSPVVHFPCRLDCPASLERATALVAAWEQDRPGVREDLRQALTGIVLVAGRLDFLVLDGHLATPGSAPYSRARGALDYRAGMHSSPSFAFFRAEMPPEGPIGGEDGRVRARDPAGALRALPGAAGPLPRLLDYR
jgi:hypothetical protein